jgi:mono/diheme cytochrome c family protein
MLHSIEKLLAPVAAITLLCLSTAVRGEADAPSAARGAETFGIYCAACHGDGATGALGPALTDPAARKDRREFGEIIRKPTPGMPVLFPATISDKDIADIETYLRSIQTTP